LKTTIVSLTEDTIRFLLEGVDVAFANALRRTMVSEVPIMTIDDIFYFDNSSLVPDELLAHRIGLVPLKEGKVTVYSGDLASQDPKITPASTRIPLAKLAPGQSIRFEAYAQLGQGKYHVKWSPVSMCVYQNVALVPGKDKAAMQECVDACGGGSTVIEGDKLKVVDIQRFEGCKRCRELVSHSEIMSNLKGDEFLFTVESNGALPPERIVKEAVKVLKRKLGDLSGKMDANDIHDEIRDFEIPEIDEGKLYSVGSGDLEEEEEEGGGGAGEDEEFRGDVEE